VAVVLRKTLVVSIDDPLAVVREFLNPDVSRSGLDRCLRRHGVGNLPDRQAKDPRPKHKAFKACEPGHLHVDVKYLPQMADESSRRYLFVAIDRATHWVFNRDLERACPIRIRTVLTENGKEFTDRLFGLRNRGATGQHEFDQLCADLGIQHRLGPPQHPQSEPLSAIGPRTMASGMVERFNARIEDILHSHHFRSGIAPFLVGRGTGNHAAPQCGSLQRAAPQSALGCRTPMQAMKH
jgi:hypothetical protein